MSRAAIIVRSSQGDEDKVSLDVQREETRELATDLGIDEVDMIDLGIHTGFSSFTRGRDANEQLDAHDDIQQLLDDLKAGIYDYVIAYDDTRLARDDFFFIIRYAAIRGSAELQFVDDIDIQSLGFRTRRVVEQYVKRKEIEKSKIARQARLDRGGYEGTPPLGTTWDDQRLHIEPDEDFEDVLDILRMRDPGVDGGTMSYTEILAETDLTNSRGTLANILDRHEEYLELACAHGYDVDELLDDEDESSDAITA